MTSTGLDTAVDKLVGPVSKVQSRQEAWLDTPFAEDSQVWQLADTLSVYSELGRLRPVTGPERSGAQQTAALRTAHRCGCGVGIRVRVPGEWSDGITEAVRALLARARSLVPVDLLLDLGSVLADRPDAGKEALRALDALVSLAEWRTTAVLAGGFPRVTADMLDGGLREDPRTDWHMWKEVRASGRSYAAALSYGDYGVQPTSALAQAPRDSSGGPAWGFLRYTTDRSFVLCGTLARGTDRIEVNRRAARRILDLAEFRGPGAGDGEQWLYDCANGPLTDSRGTGNHTQWLWSGNVQHMTYVARCLPRN